MNRREDVGWGRIGGHTSHCCIDATQVLHTQAKEKTIKHHRLEFMVQRQVGETEEEKVRWAYLWCCCAGRSHYSLRF